MKPERTRICNVWICMVFRVFVNLFGNRPTQKQNACGNLKASRHGFRKLHRKWMLIFCSDQGRSNLTTIAKDTLLFCSWVGLFLVITIHILFIMYNLVFYFHRIWLPNMPNKLKKLQKQLRITVKRPCLILHRELMTWKINEGNKPRNRKRSWKKN